MKVKAAHLLSSRWMSPLYGATMTVALLAWAMHDISAGLVCKAAQDAGLGWLALGLVTFLASFSIRALRWGTLLGTQRDPGFRICHSAIFIGFASNCVLPARGGEIVRAALLHRLGSVPFGAALGSIIAERVFDVVVVLFFLLVSFPQVTQSHQMTLAALHLGWIGAALTAVCGALFVIARWPQWIGGAGRGVSGMIRLGRFRPRIVASVDSLLSGLDILQSPKRTIIALVQGFILWGLIASTYWSTMLAFGITSPGIRGAVFVGGIAAVGIAIPSSPGNFGPFEAAIRLALGAYAVPVNTIIAYALALHFLMYVSLIMIGVTLAMRLGLSWSEITLGLTGRTEGKDHE